MGRRKIEIKAIKEERNRSVTFLKRKGGLFKKAHELSVLCSVEIAVIIFGTNKRLYEYSSGDMREILARYQYDYESPHEHKGPQDFQGKGGAVDDDDDDIEMGTSPPPDNMPHPHLHHAGMPHISRPGTASASPPIHSRVLGGYPNRNGTPQPGGSRPSSRNAPRRVSQSNLNPQNNHNQAQNGYPYIPNPSVYNPSNQHPPMSGFAYNPAQQGPPPPQAPTFTLNDERRQSLPPVFTQPPRQIISDSPPSMQSVDVLQPPTITEKKGKARSIFTPIVGPDSELTKFMFPAASDSSRSHSMENSSFLRPNSHRKPTPPPIKADDRQSPPKQSPPRSAPLPPVVPLEPTQSIAPPPPRSNSIPSAPTNRPPLKLIIPSEHAENDAVTADSSPRDNATTVSSQQPQTTRPADAPVGSVVLPPPSPSMTLLSAGATGPINPFHRPAINTTAPPDQTPLSALPSRFLPGEMLPSPSTFFSDWGATFGSRAGGADNMLPSPLNFQTPIATQPSHNIFKEDIDASSKRKSPTLDSPDAATAAAAATKKMKV